MRLLIVLALPLLSWAACPPGTVYDANYNRCYKFVTDKVAFVIAEQACMGAGGHLASIANLMENVMISVEAAQLFPGVTDVWIGANQLLGPKWGWTDGTPFSFTNWASEEPRPSNQCGSLLLQGSQWKSGACGTMKPYVCVVSPDSGASTTTRIPTTTTTAAGHCESGWSYLAVTDSCYKFLTVQNTWSNSEAQCNVYGANLASVHSTDENTFVASLATTGSTQNFANQAWIGLTNDNPSKQWQWTDGSRVDFVTWGPGEPSGGNEHCVEICSDEVAWNKGYKYKWNDTTCGTHMRAAVCKKRALH